MDFVKLVGPFGLFFIMFSLALTIKPKNFLEIFKSPLSYYVGLVCQLIGMPLIGFSLALSIPFPQEVKVGILLITCLPSTVTSNYITKKLGGNVPLSISLTATTSLLAFLTIPLILKAYFYFVFQDDTSIMFGESVLRASFTIFGIVTIPVIFGMFFNHFFENVAKKIDPIFDKLSALIFFTVLGVAIYQDFHLIPEYFKFAGIKTVLIFFIAFFMTIIMAKIFKLNEQDKITVVIETVLQNGAMGLIVGGIIFDNVTYIMPVAAYALLQYLFILVYFSYVKKVGKNK